MTNAKSNDTITNNHEAHITPDGPAGKQSNERSDAEPNYVINREAQIAPSGCNNPCAMDLS